jgi:hypothetical protein
METTTIKRKLIEEALDHLKKAQEDAWVQSTQDVIDALETALKSDSKKLCQPNDIEQARYFHFTYSFFAPTREGLGSFCVKIESGFPKKDVIKDLATKAIYGKWNMHSHDVDVIITGWIEMTEADYNDWNEK